MRGLSLLASGFNAETDLLVKAGAAWSSSMTSSTLSTAGSRRGNRTTVSRRARSGRSSVTVKKKRKAETALRLVQLEEP